MWSYSITSEWLKNFLEGNLLNWVVWGPCVSWILPAYICFSSFTAWFPCLPSLQLWGIKITLAPPATPWCEYWTLPRTDTLSLILFCQMSDHISVRKENSLNLSLGNNNCEKKKGIWPEFPGTTVFKNRHATPQPAKLPGWISSGAALRGLLARLSAPGLGGSISLIVLHMLYHLS